MDDDRPIYVNGTRGPVTNAILGALKNQINDHGPIEHYHLFSAAKRVFRALKTVDRNIRQKQFEREVRHYYKSIGVELRRRKDHNGEDLPSSALQSKCRDARGPEPPGELWAHSDQSLD